MTNRITEIKQVSRRDNVELEYKEWDNLWHVFQVESLIPESQESFKLVSKFLNTNI